MLRCAILEFKQDWDALLPYVEMCYNSTASNTTGKSPHEIVYGTQLRTPTEAMLSENTDETIPTVA